MKTIWKFPLSNISGWIIEMPVGAQVLSVQMQGPIPMLWAMVDDRAPTELRRFEIYGTGHSLPDDPGTYVGTFHMESLVLHVFDPLNVAT